jgi:hypothetical protein
MHSAREKQARLAEISSGDFGLDAIPARPGAHSKLAKRACATEDDAWRSFAVADARTSRREAHAKDPPIETG